MVDNAANILTPYGVDTTGATSTNPNYQSRLHRAAGGYLAGRGIYNQWQGNNQNMNPYIRPLGAGSYFGSGPLSYQQWQQYP